jgi:hypothetical protein
MRSGHFNMATRASFCCVCRLPGGSSKSKLLHVDVTLLVLIYLLSTQGLANKPPDYTISIIRSFLLPSWLGGTEPGFTPTGSISNTLHERSAHNRGSLRRRLHHGLFECGMWFHFISIVAVGTVMAYRTQTVLQQSQHGWDMTRITEILRQVAWPAPAWLQAIFTNMVPLVYILFPPDMPDRNSLLGDREKEGARYPLEEFKKGRSSPWAVDYPLLYTFLLGYSVVVFLWSYTI